MVLSLYGDALHASNKAISQDLVNQPNQWLIMKSRDLSSKILFDIVSE